MNHLNFVLRSEDLRDRFYLAENVENPQDDVVQLMNEPTPEQAPPPAHWGSQPSQEQTPPGPLELGNSLQQESLAVPSTEVQVPDFERVSADAGGANAQLAGSRAIFFGHYSYLYYRYLWWTAWKHQVEALRLLGALQ